MKKYSYILLFLVSNFPALRTYSAGTWTQKTNFAGTARYGSISFTIGAYAYIGLGWDGSIYRKDLWRYDPSGDTWTQQANFGGNARGGACGFSIGTKGYAGTGLDSTVTYNDWWQFDPASNTWTQKNSVPVIGRYACSAVALGTKGYIGLGASGSSGPFYNDWWEYNPTTDVWTQRANFPGAVRCGASVFSMNQRLYICAGSDVSISAYYNDLWEFTPSANSWMQKATMPGPGRSSGVAFALSGYAYYGCGKNFDLNICYNDLWKYDGAHDTWNQQTSLPASARWGATGFVLGIKAYLITGLTASGTNLRDNWQWCPVPAQPFALYGPNTICSGYNDVFSCTTVQGASSYAWTLPSGWTGSSTTNNITAMAGSTSSYLMASACNACGTGNAQYFTVAVDSSPAVPVITYNNAMLISSSSVGNQWYMNGTPIGGEINQSYTPTQTGNYSVCVSNSNACSSCSAPFNFTSVGLAENGPQKNCLILIADENGIFSVMQKGYDEVCIYNSTGACILNEHLQEGISQLDLTGRACGIFFARFSNGTDLAIKKLMIN